MPTTPLGALTGPTARPSWPDQDPQWARFQKGWASPALTTPGSATSEAGTPSIYLPARLRPTPPGAYTHTSPRLLCHSHPKPKPPAKNQGEETVTHQGAPIATTSSQVWSQGMRKGCPTEPPWEGVSSPSPGVCKPSCRVLPHPGSHTHSPSPRAQGQARKPGGDWRAGAYLTHCY